jgi:hypothetical protein
MAYLVESKIKRFFNERDRQISADGMHALELKLVDLMEKSARQFNGHKKRIGADLINMMKI